MPKKTALKTSWKQTQVTTKTKKQTKLAWIVLIFIVLIISFSQLMKFADNLFKPFHQQSATQRNYTWDGKSNINVVVNGSGVGVFSYNPLDKKISLINIPNETFINVPADYGNWQVRSIFKFGESLEQPLGNKLLKESIAEALGIPLEGYLMINTTESLTTLQIVEKIRQGPIAFLSSIKDIKTDLNFIELVKLSSGMAGVRFDKVKEINLQELAVLEEQSLPDGSRVLVPDYVRLDSVLSSFHETNFLTERASVAVFNATDTPGVAQKVARMITNMGGNVIISTNAEIKRDKTIVIASDNSELVQQTDTYKKIAKIFSSDCQKDPKCGIIVCKTDDKSHSKNCEISDPQIKLSRAKINVILGSDFANY